MHQISYLMVLCELPIHIVDIKLYKKLKNREAFLLFPRNARHSFYVAAGNNPKKGVLSQYYLFHHPFQFPAFINVVEFQVVHMHISYMTTAGVVGTGAGF